MSWRKRIPGLLATTIAMLVTGLWTYWGVAEMYYEGWWGVWTNRLPYLVPAAACLTLSLLALTWPRRASWLLFLAAGGFTLFWWGEDLLDGHGIDLESIPVFLMLGGAVWLMALLFRYEGGRRMRLRAAGDVPLARWWKRHAAALLLLAICMVIVIGVSAYYLPIVLAREDDGYRGARLIEGQDATLIWAGAGPGWNWKQSWGGYPSWKALALYGVEPVGLDYWDTKNIPVTAYHLTHTHLCSYLDAEGTTLLDTPQYIWRMPTVREIVGSLARHGVNAGCAWNGNTGFMDCNQLPDKETPLWAPDQAPIYYWAAEAYNDDFAYYVSYNGAVGRTLQRGGNPRHGYRCVKEP